MTPLEELFSGYQPPEILRSLDKIDGEESLKGFMRLMWPIVEPVRPFIDGWPLGAVCEHLQAVTDGEIKRLLINIFPGSTKSLTTDVFWPAYEWGPKNRPSLRYICVSYSKDLTKRDNTRFRRVITSPLFRAIWGDRFHVDDQADVIKIQNDQTGWKLASSIGGIGTGERGDRFVLDDPNNVKEAESDVVRDGANLYVQEVMPDRLNDLDESAIVIIQQRTHEVDVSGTILTSELDYVHLCIPNEFDASRRCVTVLDWRDPRTTDGELAWPERLSERATAEMKMAKGPYAYAGQYQQIPEPRGGGIVKRAWWNIWPPEDYEAQYVKMVEQDDGSTKRVERFPDFWFMLAGVDTAYTANESNDASACTVWGMWSDRAKRPRIMLVEAWREHLELHDLVNRIIDTCRRRKVDTLLVEAKASGISTGQEIRRLTRAGEWRTILTTPEGDKVARMHAAVPILSGGLVYAPDRGWSDKVISACASFPMGRDKDFPDTVSMCLTWLRKSDIAQMPAEFDESEMAASMFRPKLEAPYDV